MNLVPGLRTLKNTTDIYEVDKNMCVFWSIRGLTFCDCKKEATLYNNSEIEDQGLVYIGAKAISFPDGFV